jgi:hypothetical protein
MQAFVNTPNQRVISVTAVDRELSHRSIEYSWTCSHEGPESRSQIAGPVARGP